MILLAWDGPEFDGMINVWDACRDATVEKRGIGVGALLSLT